MEHIQVNLIHMQHLTKHALYFPPLLTNKKKKLFSGNETENKSHCSLNFSILY